MTSADLDFTELAPGRWETVTRTGREFTITWANPWIAHHLPPDATAGTMAVSSQPLPTFRRAVQWCAAQCGPDDEEPF